MITRNFKHEQHTHTHTPVSFREKPTRGPVNTTRSFRTTFSSLLVARDCVRCPKPVRWFFRHPRTNTIATLPTNHKYQIFPPPSTRSLPNNAKTAVSVYVYTKGTKDDRGGPTDTRRRASLRERIQEWTSTGQSKRTIERFHRNGNLDFIYFFFVSQRKKKTLKLILLNREILAQWRVSLSRSRDILYLIFIVVKHSSNIYRSQNRVIK